MFSAKAFSILEAQSWRVKVGEMIFLRLIMALSKALIYIRQVVQFAFYKKRDGAWVYWPIDRGINAITWST
jgi:hypothetical protein